MFDLITYCNDTNALLAEVAETMPDRLITDIDTGEQIGIAVAKTPTVRNGTETLSIVRVCSAELTTLKKLRCISILAEVAAGGDLLFELDKVPANAAIYDRVHDQSPYDITDETGKVIGSITPPRLIGAFA